MKKTPFEKHLERQRKSINNLMKAFSVASRKGNTKRVRT